MTGDEAELRLKQCGGDSCYLMRYSKKEQTYKISLVNSETGVAHIKINIFQQLYQVEGSENRFEYISDLLEFYQRNKIRHNIDSIGIEIERGTFKKNKQR